MTNKFTIRDFLVYAFVGLSAGILIFIHESEKANEFIKSIYKFSSFTTIIFVPIFYLLGHLIMGIDDLIFNKLLNLAIGKTEYKKANWICKTYNFIFFGYRNQGIKWTEEIGNKEFLEKCDYLIKENRYAKAEYYQVMSDLFKGIFLCLLISIIFGLINCEINYWEIGILFIVWYRARIFSAYYVRMVKRSAK
ncbi:hypothetical protein [Tenacibaculum finnmarkense]|uniref:hypothetical protein n=1 Tax=Tenacibaculum finnmarkense TaxID=2781243 RepID=UPI001E5A19C8|nr:hypothetical protein [Tenacibaculum finnmarkense]MCD8413712.1 hypothetical protein [Tenacibaculum finnmarkense genomovar ulcerans]